ncbi:MAG: hypothetical protein WKG00_05075 [Polyangiaceae bacterium]
MTRASLLAACASATLGCALTPLDAPSETGVDGDAAAALVPFVDINPDPGIVEVELVAEPASFEYLAGAPPPCGRTATPRRRTPPHAYPVRCSRRGAATG